MRFVLMAVGVGLALTGCSAPQPSSSSTAHGRYVGIGVYSAGEMWSKMVLASPAPAASAATTADDEHVIVVVDSLTGEVRECGDYTGLCVSMNPWTKAIGAPQNAPVTLTKHQAEIVQGQTVVTLQARQPPNAADHGAGESTPAGPASPPAR